MTPPLDKARGLPELPKSLFVGQTTNQPLYTATQLQEYGQRCIDEAHTALLAEVERLRWIYGPGLEYVNIAALTTDTSDVGFEYAVDKAIDAAREGVSREK